MSGGASISLAVDANDIPFGDNVVSGKVFEKYTRQWSEVKSVQLHDIPSLFN